jgi:hypothetical protein
MSTGAHRAIEVIVGIALVSYCGCAIYSGRIQGSYRSATRTEKPWSFWATVLIAIGVALVFLTGYVTWRH